MQRRYPDCLPSVRVMIGLCCVTGMGPGSAGLVAPAVCVAQQGAAPSGQVPTAEIQSLWKQVGAIGSAEREPGKVARLELLLRQAIQGSLRPPERMYYKGMLAWTILIAGRPSESLTVFQDVLKDFPQPADETRLRLVLTGMALCQEKLGKWEDALTLYLEAAGEAPVTAAQWQGIYHAAKCARTLGRARDSASYLRQLLDAESLDADKFATRAVTDLNASAKTDPEARAVLDELGLTVHHQVQRRSDDAVEIVWSPSPLSTDTAVLIPTNPQYMGGQHASILVVSGTREHLTHVPLLRMGGSPRLPRDETPRAVRLELWYTSRSEQGILRQPAVNRRTRVAVHAITSPWDATTASWESRPAWDAKPLGFLEVKGETDGWTSVDITSAWQLARGKLQGFAILSADTDAYSLLFIGPRSSRHREQRPRLVFTMGVQQDNPAVPGAPSTVPESR